MSVTTRLRRRHSLSTRLTFSRATPAMAARSLAASTFLTELAKLVGSPAGPRCWRQFDLSQTRSFAPVIPGPWGAIRRPIRLIRPDEGSDLRYEFEIKEDCNGKEALQA